jgi:hypothetical protein
VFNSSPEAGPVRVQSLLRRLLPFPRLIIEKVSLDKFERLVVEVRPRGSPRCPCCHRNALIYDHRPSRDWRHFDFGGHQVILRASSMRRVDCRRCGTVRVEEVTWAAPDSDFTLPFEDQVGWLLQHCDKTTISTLMRIAWRTVGSIVARVVGRCRLPIDLSMLSAIGVDEISFRKGHRYLTLVTDHGSGRVSWARCEGSAIGGHFPRGFGPGTGRPAGSAGMRESGQAGERSGSAIGGHRPALSPPGSCDTVGAARLC